MRRFSQRPYRASGPTPCDGNGVGAKVKTGGRWACVRTTADSTGDEHHGGLESARDELASWAAHYVDQGWKVLNLSQDYAHLHDAEGHHVRLHTEII